MSDLVPRTPQRTLESRRKMCQGPVTPAPARAQLPHHYHAHETRARDAKSQPRACGNDLVMTYVRKKSLPFPGALSSQILMFSEGPGDQGGRGIRPGRVSNNFLIIVQGVCKIRGSGDQEEADNTRSGIFFQQLRSQAQACRLQWRQYDMQRTYFG